MVRALAAPLVPCVQDDTLATYAQKISKQEALIDWSESAEAVARKVRAFNPVPGAASSVGDTFIKIWRVQVEPGVSAAPGVVCEAGATGIVVGCGQGGVRLLELQRAGGKRLPATAFLAGFDLAPGTRLGA